ncbi:adenylyltransferase/cytidyltransferase family protein [Candidatus Micrarchaeota archaeon]|nr:adenylyltransferase/cytidyltransferase family protein [Candidatus Micrarchaeota archaeon]
MKEAARLYLMQLQYGGIPEDIFHFLTGREKEMLIEREGRFFLKDAERKRIKVVLTGGVFDILHIGHIVTLSEARKHGDVLVVAIARNEHIRKKGREPIHDVEYRKIMVECLKPVDLAVEGFDKPERMLELVKPDVIVYGYDQKEAPAPKGVAVVKLEKKVDDGKFKTSRILEDLGL